MKLYMQHNIGHRERARERLMDSKPGAMQDYELLELLLFMAIPRKDTKFLAKSLINKYGSFAKVINAEQESLMEVKGVSKNTLACFKLIKEGVIRITREEMINKPIISSWQSLLDYCRAALGHLKKEVFLIIYLNNQNELIDEDLQEYGTVDQVSVYPREITKRALFLNASAIIMVHNHPGGNTKASKEDIEVTRHISNALSPFKIKIHDHIIISDKSFFSFKSEGLF